MVVLQDALESAREELEEQRRLNQALINRRVRLEFRLCVWSVVMVLCFLLQVFKGNQLAESKQRPHHNCIK